jgi:hypothetical protein
MEMYEGNKTSTKGLIGKPQGRDCLGYLINQRIIFNGT